MPIAPPLVPLDPDVVSLFWKDMPEGVIPGACVDLASAISGASPFLRQLMLRDPAYAGRVFSEDPQPLLAELLASLNGFTADLSQADVMRALRQAKKKASLLIAVADLSGRWSVEQVTAPIGRSQMTMLPRS
jgi:glutamate-ammonia-ligase adenylyltransferase